MPEQQHKTSLTRREKNATVVALVVASDAVGEVSGFEWLSSRPIACVCCDAPATHALGDWDVCEEHYNILAAPWPEELIWP